MKHLLLFSFACLILTGTAVAQKEEESPIDEKTQDELKEQILYGEKELERREAQKKGDNSSFTIKGSDFDNKKKGFEEVSTTVEEVERNNTEPLNTEGQLEKSTINIDENSSIDVDSHFEALEKEFEGANYVEKKNGIPQDQQVETDPIPAPIVVTAPNQTNTRYSNNSEESIHTLAGRTSHHGGFGAIAFKISEFNNKNTLMLGVRGGWIINRSIALGFEGWGIIPNVEYKIDYEFLGVIENITARAVGGYGGFFLEPIVFSNSVIHFTFPISIGAGWVGYVRDWETYDYYADGFIAGDMFWYVEPGAALEINVSRNFRMGIGASKRFTDDLNLSDTPPTAFDGWAYFLTLKFGRF